MNAERLQDLILYKYRYFISYTLVITTGIGALVFRLTNLLPGISPAETKQGLSLILDSANILEKGVYLPYNLLQTISIDIFGETALGLRAPSLIMGILTLLFMFILLHMWHKDKIAIASVLFLATSSWFLVFARSGTPAIFMVLSVVLIFLSGTIVRHSQRPRVALVFAALGLSIALYAPYMIYLVLVFLYLYRKQLIEIFHRITASNLVVLAVIGIASLMPLLYGFISDSENFKIWLGISNGIPTPINYLQNISSVFQYVLWNSAERPEFHLGTLSQLDIFTSTMTALGLYHYERHFNLLRTRFIIYGLGFSILVLGLTSDETNYVILIPIIYILAATGIVTLLNQWNKIFPINPFARTLGLLPLAIVILMTSQYHLDRYFSAWANNPSVRQIYAVEPSLLFEVVEQTEAKRILIIANSSQVDAITFLTYPERSEKRIDIVTSVNKNRLSLLTEKYDLVIVDTSSQTKPILTTLGKYRTTVVESPRELRPIAYVIYDLEQIEETTNNF
jgi:4-amino-4-deoxy-L-arabinose transferase-like glycosyltransferase